MCKYCSKPCNNENILDTCSADGYSFQKIYIARVTVPSHESFIPKERFCLVVRHAFMGNSCETITPIDYCIKCGRNLEDTTMSNLNHDENFSLKKEPRKMSKLTPIDLECNMGKDINGVEHREPWKAYDIDEVDALLAKKDEKIRRLQRALWLVRAERYKMREFIAREEGNLSSQMSWSRFLRERTYSQWVGQLLKIANLANKLQNKCRAKADEYT